jgi:hypothetical protein
MSASKSQSEMRSSRTTLSGLMFPRCGNEIVADDALGFDVPAVREFGFRGGGLTACLAHALTMREQGVF